MRPIRPRVRHLFRRDRWTKDDATRELHDEIELHIALRAEQLERNGWSRVDAEREARRLFAMSESTVAELRDSAVDRDRAMRMREALDAIWQDVRYAARRLLREPAITAFILATLALGIGVNVAALSIADRVLLSGPQHVREPRRLIRLYSRVAQRATGSRTGPWLPYPAFLLLRDHLHSIDGMGAYRVDDAVVGSGANSATRRVSMMSSEMFPLLGVHAQRGRFYDQSEDAENVAVLADGYWRTMLGGDPEIIGKSIAIDGTPHVVVGIAPAGFTGADFRRVDVWRPVTMQARTSMNLQLVARLKPGVRFEDAAREVASSRPLLEAALPRWAQWLRGAEYLAAPIAYDASAHESLEAVLARWLTGISAIILLASCANVANLLLARLARRRRELAVRIALGAGRARVMRLLGLEGILIAVGAAALAIVVIALIEPVLQGALFPDGSWAFSMFDARVVGAIAAFALITGVLVSVAPAVQAGRRDIRDMLHGDDRDGDSRSPMRSGLTVVQATMSVVLLVGAGLFLRSLERVSAVDLGMDSDRVLLAETRYARTTRQPDESLAQWASRLAAMDRDRHHVLLDAVRSVAGVEKAAVAIGVPFYEGMSEGVWLPGRDSVPVTPDGGPFIMAVSADYFAAIGTAIHRGRAFDAGDGEHSEPVVVVNETMARALWPHDDALGKCLRVGDREAPCARVIGVAADTHRSGLREEPSLQYYVPIGQERGFSGSWLIVRPHGDPIRVARAVREALTTADPALLAVDVRPLSRGYDGEMRPLRLGMVAFGLSASLALIVAGLGLYSIMAHAVAWRRHEFGVRLALGARPGSIVRLVVGRGAVLATIGTGIGLIIAIGARRWVEPLLFNTSATDPIVLIGVVIVLEVMALLAGWLPTHRAAHVSPMEALRTE